MKSSKRIYINGRFLTQSTTGVQRFASELTREIVKLAQERGLSIELLIPTHSRVMFQDFPALVKRRGWFGGYLWEQFVLPFISWNTLLVNLGNVAPLMKRRQIVLVYDAAVWRVPFTYTWQFRAIYKLLIPFVARHALGVATISNASADDISHFAKVPRGRITVLRAGAEHMARVPATTTFASEHHLNRPFVLAAGSLSPNKNFGAIVRAFDLLDAPDFDLVIVGGSDSTVFAKSAIRFSERVKLVGRVSDSQLRELYEKAALFVFPSFYEGMGLPPMEAMMCGCPVLLSDIPVFREIYGDAVAYCDPASDRDVAEKMATLMSRPDQRTALRQAGWSQVSQRHWRQGAEDLLSLIVRANGDQPGA